MTRILWADDQQDVIKTLSGLLSPLGPKITPVKSGTEALSKLKANYFDILVLDLMMPPDKWGGLWLLEEIRKTRIRIPVIVLSGEGTQSETIKALRLGAKDYVTKDKVQTEFLQRVRAVIEESIREIDSHVTTSFPTPLALPYKRYLTTTTLVSQLRRLIEFYESSLRLCCIIGICELGFSYGGSIDSPRWASALIRGPSMGTWNQIRRALAKRLHQDSAFLQLHNSFDNKAMNSIIQLRNDISHGAEPSERFAQECLEKWKPQLQVLVSKLWQNLSLQIFLPLSLHFDGTKFQIDGRALTGDSVALPKFAVETTKPLICDQLYLLAEENMQNQCVNLFPLVCAEPAVEPTAWQVLIFDGLVVDRDTQTLTGEEPIRYLNIWSGQRNVVPASKPNSNMLPEFLTQRIASQ
ncbi:MAG: response regulator transcription factor [Anaerolineae bacterium]